ncbi:hypothetical protein LUZ60_009351 [Juncus effusus]|nr:hypothetical protein LUZ60_009351 [Juncus effusus]
MDEINRENDNNSWFRRTNYSHTVCHRIDPSRLQSISFKPGSNNPARPRSNFTSLSMPVSRAERPESSTQRASYRQSISMPNNSNSQKDTKRSKSDLNTNGGRRSLSPVPTSVISDIFKEARATANRRFATPPPRPRVNSVNSPLARTISTPARPNSKRDKRNLISRSLSPIRTPKSKKDAHWSKKYFDHGVSKVSALNGQSSDISVDMSKLYLGLRFASGANSRLYHGIYDEEEVAVKIIRQPEDDDENGEEGNGMAKKLEKQYVREVGCLSHLHHKNVIKLIAASKNPPIFCIVTEYLSGGSLRSFLHKLGQAPVSLPKLLSIALHVARGMEYIHSQGVIHRDLKPENILTDEGQENVKIADFGISCEEAYCDVMEEDPGTYRWMAPEMIRHERYGRKVDVYSFGLLLWEMVSGRIPYQEMTPIQAAFAVVDKNLRPIVPQDCPMALRALIEQCWALRPDRRPDFWQIVKVLEQFEVAMNETGTLDSVKNVTCKDHKKWIHKLVQKLKPSSSSSSASSVRAGVVS